MAQLALDPLIVVSFNALLQAETTHADSLSREEILDLMMAMVDTTTAPAPPASPSVTLWNPPGASQIG